MARNFQSLSYRLGGKTIVEVIGEIDGSTAAEVCYRIQVLDLHECTLDLSRVEAVEVFGARVLAQGLKSLKERGVRFELGGLPKNKTATLCLGGVLEAIV